MNTAVNTAVIEHRGKWRSREVKRAACEGMQTKQGIWIISDDLDTAQVWAVALRQRGHHTQVTHTSSSLQAANEEAGSIDLVIVDLYQDNSDAIELLRKVRADIKCPILLLTYEQDERFHLEVYRTGTEECISKPIGIKLLLCKVDVWMRRSHHVTNSQTDHSKHYFSFGDAQRQVVFPDGTARRLSNLEFRLFQFLVANEGRTLETQQIIKRVWADYESGDQSLLKNLVYRLRNKLEPNPSMPRYIQTIPGIGYAFYAD